MSTDETPIYRPEWPPWHPDADPVMVAFAVVFPDSPVVRAHRFDRAEWERMSATQRRDMLRAHLDELIGEVVTGVWQVAEADADAPGAAFPYVAGS
jgi:hypothetical protein